MIPTQGMPTEGRRPEVYGPGTPPEEWGRLSDAEDTINRLGADFSARLIGELQPGQVIFDVGAGSSIEARRYVRSQGGIYIALDRSQKAAEKARELLTESELQDKLSSFMIGDASKGFLLPDASVDVIHARYLLAFFDPETRAQILKEMYRVLKPGGRLILIDYDWAVVDGSPAVQELRDIGINEAKLFDACYGTKSAHEVSTILGKGVSVETRRQMFPYPLKDFKPLRKLEPIIVKGLSEQETEGSAQDKDDESPVQRVKFLFERIQIEALLSLSKGYRWPDAVGVVARKLG